MTDQDIRKILIGPPRKVFSEDQWQRERKRIRMYVYALAIVNAVVFAIVVNVMVH